MAKSKPTTPHKPRPDFPLFPHSRGYWAKKVRGELRYFGKVSDNPTAPIIMRRVPGSSRRSAHGRIAEPSVYDRALTAEKTVRHYKAAGRDK